MAAANPLMPIPKSKYAPRFNGKDGGIRDFIDEFEACATVSGLNDAVRCVQVGRYAKKSAKELWEKLPSFTANPQVWQTYRDAIIALYPGEDISHKFSPAELVRIAKKAKKSKMKTLKDFGTYDRRFRRVSLWLVNENKMHDTEAQRLYWDGIPSKLRHKVNSRLQISIPNHDPIESYTMDQIKDAAFYVLKGNEPLGVLSTLDSDSDESSSSSSSSSSSDSSDSEEESRKKKKKSKRSNDKERASSSSPTSVQVKIEENSSKDQLRDLITQIHQQNANQNKERKEMGQTLENLRSLIQAQASVINPPFRPGAPTHPGMAYSRPPADPNAPQTCSFCGLQGHFLRECLVAAEYVSEGKIKKDQGTNKYVTMTGEDIPYGQKGQCLKARIDAYNSRMQSMFSAISPAVMKESTTGVMMLEAYHAKEEYSNKVTSAVYAPSPSDDDSSEMTKFKLVLALAAEIQVKEREGPAGNTRSRTKAQPSVPVVQPQPVPQPVPQTVPQPEGQESQPPGPGPKFQYRSRAEEPKLIEELVKMILDNQLDRITTAHVFASSRPVRDYVISYLKSHRVEVGQFIDIEPVITANLHVSEDSLKLREIEVLVGNRIPIRATVDDGSQIITIREDIWKDLQLPILPFENMTMESADQGISQTKGKVENLPISIGPITYYVQAQVVGRSPTAMLLGLPFWALANCHKDVYPDGYMSLTLSNPNPPFQTIIVPTIPRDPQTGKQEIRDALSWCITPVEDEEALRKSTSHKRSEMSTAIAAAKGVFIRSTYKPVAKKILPVPGVLPNEFKNVRRFPEDPLLSLPDVNPKPPSFQPGQCLTLERWLVIEEELRTEGFLWPEEIRLVGSILRANEYAIAWEDPEKGQFRKDYFEPVKMPTIPHIPWVQKNMRVPPGIRDQLIKELKRKIDMKIIEPSNSSYRCRWFTVPKKDGSPRIVWNLEPLNAVTIRDAGVPPIMDEIIEDCAGRACYGLGDVYIGFDHRTLDESSRDLTTFQTPLGPFRLTTLPMGWTNSVTIFHQDICFILQDEIPDVAQPFMDDVAIKGPKSRYLNDDGLYEVIKENPGIRRFIFEHLVNLNRILHRFKHSGATFSAKKLVICRPEITILGHSCGFYGRKPDQSHISKILDWPACRNLTEVRGFLGTTGLVRIFIKDYSKRAWALNKLTKKDIEFTWGPDQETAMKDLKQATTSAPALRPIDYRSDRWVILAVDSSMIAGGYVLMQEDDKGKRHPARYGSMTWKDAETRYSQAKLELYGLMRALRDVRPFIIGVINLKVEVDAAYIKGMINNPDEAPNATLNRWIAYILLFHFKLVHVPAERHKGPDGLSRRFPTPQEQAEVEENIEEAIDRRLESFMYFETVPRMEILISADASGERKELPRNEIMTKRDQAIDKIQKYLENFDLDDALTPEEKKRLMADAAKFFTRFGNLYRRQTNLKHQKYVPYGERLRILEQIHDETGHKGFFPTQRLLRDRFWWPTVLEDLKWYLATCHECQIRNMFKMKIPPTVAEPASLFSKAYCDTMYMPKHGGYRYIAHARCSVSAWPEWKALAKETARTLGDFIFQEILCRWGALSTIVTDNGKPWIAAVEYLSEKYHINHIRISAYNSQAQGPIERQHLVIRESIVKACKGKLSRWPIVAPYCFWADRITTRKLIGHSPFYMAHGTEPVMPFDLMEATYLAPELREMKTTEELIAIRAMQLEKRPEELAKISADVWKSRKAAANDFARKFERSTRKFNLKPGTLVLVRNSAKETDLGKKWKPRYLGPYIVVRQTDNGGYILAEMDGTISKLSFAERRVIPYHWRFLSDVPDNSLDVDEANMES